MHTQNQFAALCLLTLSATASLAAFREPIMLNPPHIDANGNPAAKGTCAPEASCDGPAAKPGKTPQASPAAPLPKVAGPGHLDTLLALAVAAAYERDIAKTDRLTAQVLKIDPKNSRAYNARGLARMEDDCDAALPEFERALKLEPHSTAALYNKGTCQFRRQQLTEARETFSRAIAVNPTSTKQSRESRADIAFAQDDFDAALADYRYLLEHGAQWDSTMLSICAILGQKGDTEQALQTCNMVLAKTPQHIGAFLSRASVFLAAKKYDRAIADYSTVIKIKPRFSYPYYLRAKAYAARTVANPTSMDKARAAADYETALSLDPNFFDAADGVGRSYFELGQPDDAIRALTQAIERKPTADAYYWLGRAYIQKNNGDRANAEAQTCFRKAIAIDPDHRDTKRFLIDS